jgi:hypothetical protein
MILEVTLWIAQIALAGLFAFGGFMKLARTPEDLAKMWPWANDVPPSLTKFIGVAELAGAVGVILPLLTGILPWLTPLAAIGFLAIQSIAFGFHLQRGERGILWLNVIIAAASVFVVWGRWDLFFGA